MKAGGSKIAVHNHKKLGALRTCCRDVESTSLSRLEAATPRDRPLNYAIAAKRHFTTIHGEGDNWALGSQVTLCICGTFVW